VPITGRKLLKQFAYPQLLLGLIHVVKPRAKLGLSSRRLLTQKQQMPFKTDTPLSFASKTGPRPRNRRPILIFN
jgi:hypothetical protein